MNPKRFRFLMRVVTVLVTISVFMGNFVGLSSFVEEIRATDQDNQIQPNVSIANINNALGSPISNISNYKIESGFKYGDIVHMWKNCRGIDTGTPFNNPSAAGYHAGVDFIHKNSLGTNEVNGSDEDYNKCHEATVNANDNVLSIYGGTIANSKKTNSEGTWLVIKHDPIPGVNGTLYSAYFHLKDVPADYLIKGKPVSKGATLGKIAQVGNNPHLHFELRTFEEFELPNQGSGYTRTDPRSFNSGYYNPCDLIVCNFEPQIYPCENFVNASAVSVFVNRDCTGDSKNYDAGTNRINYIYPDQFNDSISSIRVKQGWSVRVYKDHSFYSSETSRCVTSSLWDLSKDYFRSGQTGLTIEDKISSIQVFNDISCGRGNVCTNPDATVQAASTQNTCGGSGGGGTQTGCTGLANGKYCGSTLGLSSSSLYQCTNGTSSLVQACSYGCNVQAQGTADYCNPAPTTSTNNCPNSLNGKYCGSGLGSQYEQQSLYNCSNGTISKIMACTNGCLQKPAGTDDVCQTPNSGGTGTACPSNGLFCGTTLGRDPNTLYRCNNGAITVESQCSNGCELKPFGTPDACYPAGSGSGGNTGEKVKIYQDSNYSGTLRLETAVDSNDPSLGSPYKSISIPTGWSVILKDKPLGYVGHEQCFNQSIPNLESHGNWAFSLDSIIVHKTNVCPVMSNEAWVRICKVTGWWENHPNECIKVTENIPDLAGYGFGDNNLRAIFFAGNWEATLYEHGNYDGAKKTISDNNTDLGSINIGHGSSSIQVRSKEPALFTLRSAVGVEWKSDRSITNLDKWERGAGYTWGDYAKYISVASGYEAIVFEDQWFTSRSRRYGPGTQMELHDLSEKVSSVQICKGTCPPAPAIPVAISPIDTETFLPGTPISFSWSGNGVRSYVEITGGNLSAPITSNWVNTTTTWTKTDLPASVNPYYWKVRSGNDYGESSFSPVYSFKVQDIAPTSVYIYQDQDSELGVDTVLSAFVSPSAAEHLAYVWSPAPKSGQGTETAVYNWSSPGQKQVTLTVSNSGGTIQKTYDVNVLCSNGAFLVEYYNNITLTGNSGKYECIDSIDQNWGALGPQGIGASHIFGNGENGDLIINANTVVSPIDSIAAGLIGSTTLNATNPAFSPGQNVLIHQTQGLIDAGKYELNQIAQYTAGQITLKNPLSNTFKTDSENKAQVIVLNQYKNVTIAPGVTLNAKPWNGSTGGILSFYSNGLMDVKGTLSVRGQDGTATSSTHTPGAIGGGFRGGASNKAVNGESNVRPYTGEAHIGPSLKGTGYVGQPTNGNGGSPASYNNGTLARSGAGGGNGTVGSNGTASYGGIAYGNAEMTLLPFGGGGGGGGKGDAVAGNAGSGGSGGGAMFIIANQVNIDANGAIDLKGGNGGADSQSAGGAGAGGSILLKTGSAQIGVSRIVASGGTSQGGGNGGVGRIAFYYCDQISGSTAITPFKSKLDCESDNFSARYTKTETLASGNYTFTTVADDGVKLWIDGNLVIDSWTDGLSTKTASLPLNSGEHTIKLEYYENTGTAQVKLSWTKDSELNVAPVVTQIPAQTINSGTNFATINLSNYGTDSDAGDTITWSYSGNTNITVSIVNNVATLTYPAHWIGTENITFKATDAGGLSDDSSASFTVQPITTDTNNVLKLLNGGTLSAIDGTGLVVNKIASAKGGNYDGTVNKPLTYTITGLKGTYNTAETTKFKLFIDSLTNVGNGTQVKVSYDLNGDGTDDRTETYKYFATDNVNGYQTYTQAKKIKASTGTFADMTNGTVKVEIWNAIGNSAVKLRTSATQAQGKQSQITIPFTLTTTRPNTAPVVTQIPSQTIIAPTTFATINLSTYVTDADVGDVITWSYSGNTNINVAIVNNIATLSYVQPWIGKEDITFKATDAGGLFSETIASFSVTPKPIKYKSVQHLLKSGILSAKAGAGAVVSTISSANGQNYDGTVNNPLTFVTSGLTATYVAGKQTSFRLYLDSGIQVGNGTQIKVSYDFDSNQTIDRTEVYNYFATNDLAGYESYTDSLGLKSSTGEYQNLVGGTVKVEIWNAIGNSPVKLRTDATAIEGKQSILILPFN